MAIKSCFKSLFQFFDQYGAPVHMQYQLSTVFRTFLGGVISCIVYIVFLAIAAYLYSDLEAKSNYIITTYSNTFEDPPKFELTTDELELDYLNKTDRGYFFYAFLIRDKNTGKTYSKEEVDKVFFVETYDAMRNKTEGKFTNLNQYELISCKEMFPNKNLTTLFNNRYLEFSLCLNNSLTFVQGDFISNLFRYIGIKFKECSKSNLKSKPICASKNEIDQAKKNWNINLLYTDYKLDPTIHNKSPINYVLSKLEIDIVSTIYQKFDIYLGKYELVSFDSVYNSFTEFFKQPIISVNKIVKQDSSPSSTFLALYLRSDYEYKKYIRNYKNIIDFVGQVGGIWKVVFTIGAFIMVPLNFRLLNIAISNEMFNLIHPNITKEIEKQTYENFMRRSSPANPNKLIAAYAKNPLESKMAINYYKFERNKGMSFSVKEAFLSIFLLCCKTETMKNKEQIFIEAEEKLFHKLNISTLLNFSKQLNLMKNAILGNKKLMVEFSNKYAIHFYKLDIVEKKYKSYVEKQIYEPEDLAVLKEKFFISGMRAMKNKFGGLNEKVDLDLIEMFNFNKKHLARYFFNHMETLELKYPDLKEFLSKKDKYEKTKKI